MPFLSNGIGGPPEHIGYVACSCGWRGPSRAITDIAHMTCRRAWIRHHDDLAPAPARAELLSSTTACLDLRS